MASGYGVYIIAVLWGIGFSVSVFHLIAHKAPLLPTILGQWSLVGASLLYGGVGYYVSQSVDTEQEYDQLGKYTLGMFSFAGLASGGYAAHQYLSPLAELRIEGVLFQAIFVALIGGTIGMFIGWDIVQRDRITNQLTALNNLNKIARDITRVLTDQTTREDIEQVACERLAESDSYEYAWIGTADEQTQEVVPSTSANTQGYLDEITITVDDSKAGEGPTGEAFRTGEPQVVRDIHTAPTYRPWRGKARKRGINCTAAIPITYEEHFYGVLNIYSARKYAFDGDEQEVVIQLGEIIGLAIAAVEHEQQLEYERERLEFVNRLLRHKILNGLNAAQGYTGLLEPQVDDEDTRHLKIVRDRIDGMIDLISKLRSLMKMITDEDHVRQPVNLADTLEDKLEQARETYPDAQFEFRGNLDESDEVLANELLGEVFENILTNAVVHNDADTPEVTVSVKRAAETVTVHVADNGPGIPDDLKDCIFEKGEKNFDSPGTGFGLHLAREIIESCDGRISVTDTDPTGAVFSVTLDWA